MASSRFELRMDARVACVILLVLTVKAFLFPQSIRQLTVNDGLSQGFVSSIQVDQEGFLWISTLDGLNRYDGQAFKIWRPSAKEPLALASNHIFHSSLDQFGNLWVSSEVGIQIMDRKRGKFYAPECVRSCALDGTKDLVLGKGNSCWLLQRNSLFHLNAPPTVRDPAQLAAQMTLRQVDYPVGETGEIKCLEAVDTALLLGGKNGLFSLSFRDGQLHRVSETLPQSAVYNLWRDSASGNLWVQFETRIYLLDARGQRSFDLEHPTARGNIRSVVIGKKSYFFSARRIYEWDGNTFQALPVQITEQIMSAAADRFGNLWIGTNARGLRMIQPGKKLIPKYLDPISISMPLETDPAGNLWIMTKPEPPAAGSFATYHRFLPDKGNLGESFSSIGQLAMAPAPDGGYWMVGRDRKLYHLNRQRMQDQSVALHNLPEKTNIRGMLLRRNGRVVVLAGSGFWVEFDPKTGMEKQYTLPYSDKPKPVPKPNAWLEGADGSLWIGTDDGLFGVAAETEPGKPEIRFFHAKSSPLALTHDRVCSLLTDPADDSILWVGTQHGLNRLDIRRGQIRSFTRDDGFPDDVIYGMLPGSANSIWLSTNLGLIEFDTRHFDFHYYTESDGLPSSEFNTNAAARGADGRLWFGNVNGLVGFYPEEMTRQQVRAPVLFTGVHLNRKLTGDAEAAFSADPDVAYAAEIRLPDHCNALTLSFALLDLSAPDENMYRYRLNGPDNAWNTLGRTASVSFAGLTPGSYDLEVQGQNGQSGWSDSARLKITVVLHWWQTAWAKSMWFTLVLALLVGATYRWLRGKYGHRPDELKPQISGVGQGANPWIPISPVAPMQDETSASGQDQDDVFIHALKQIIARHYQDPEFGVSDILKEMALSKSHLHRKLSALTGQSAGALLRQFRLERAKKLLLENPDISIGKVALETGFSDASYFARVFSSEYGCPPKAFQKKA